MDLKTLVASALLALSNSDVQTVYALVLVVKEELKAKIEVTPLSVEQTLEQLVEEGYAASYEETTLDLTKRYKKYVPTDKIRNIARPLPPKATKLAELRYVTPTFYLLINYGIS